MHEINSLKDCTSPLYGMAFKIIFSIVQSKGIEIGGGFVNIVMEYMDAGSLDRVWWNDYSIQVDV